MQRILSNKFTTIEVIAVECTIGIRELIVLSIYRPPKRSSGPGYNIKVEDEMKDLFQWDNLHKQTVVAIGDLNFDRLRPNKEGNILKDIEDVNGLECMITEPTRETTHFSNAA